MLSLCSGEKHHCVMYIGIRIVSEVQEFMFNLSQTDPQGIVSLSDGDIVFNTSSTH